VSQNAGRGLIDAPLPGPKSGNHLTGGWIDDGVPVYHDGGNRLVATSDRSDEGRCVGVLPDVDLADRKTMPPQNKAQPQAEHAAGAPVHRDLVVNQGG